MYFGMHITLINLECLEPSTIRENIHLVFNKDDSILTQNLLSNNIVCQRNHLGVYLSITSHVNQLSNILQIRIAISHICFTRLQHIHSCFVHFQEDAIEDLPKTQ